ncbi:hypothetical protein M433DRAFT_49810, partial [Acidomyces richmondensis BFW]
PNPQMNFVFHLECSLKGFKYVIEGSPFDRSTIIFSCGQPEAPNVQVKLLPEGG